MRMKNPRLRLALLTPIATAILLLAAYAMSQQGSWFPALIFAALAVLTLVFTTLMLVPSRRQLVRRGGGIGLTNSPAIALIVTSFLVLGLLVPVSLVTLWVSSGERPISATGPLVMSGLGVALAAPVLMRLLRGGYRLGGLELTPEAIFYATYAREHSIRWSDLVEVELRPNSLVLDLFTVQLPTVRGPRVLVGERPSGSRAHADPRTLTIPPRMLRTDAAELQALLEYYRRHPKRRHELGDGTALERTFDLVAD
jgi:hypothetical protein